jgi:hypothetical protein
MPLLLVACTPMIAPGTGDVAFRLEWQGHSDLDLRVEDPCGEALHFNHRESESGGVLDVDCNAVEQCDRPIENVYWPHGQAPRGRYRFKVTLFRVEPDEPEVDFVLKVLLGNAEVRRLPGTLRELQESTEGMVYDFDAPSVAVCTFD